MKGLHSPSEGLVIDQINKIQADLIRARVQAAVLALDLQQGLAEESDILAFQNTIHDLGGLPIRHLRLRGDQIEAVQRYL